jgi:HlyD family secretion protein
MLDGLKKLVTLFTKTQRRDYFVLQFFFLLTACIQVVGIASIAPFIALVSNPGLIHSNPVAAELYRLSGAGSNLDFLTYFAVAVMGVIIFSNLVFGVATWLSFYFSLNLGNELEDALYRNYLHRNFVFFSRNNSSTITGVLSSEVPRFVYMVLMPIMALASQLFVIIIIVGGLIYVDPILALMSLLIVAGSYLLVFRLIRTRLAEHGRNAAVLMDAKFKHLNETFGGIKEIKLLGSERLFEQVYRDIIDNRVVSFAFMQVSADIPKFFIETIALCSLLGLAIYLLFTQGESSAVVSTLSLYGMAGYRLLPAAQVAYKSIAQIRGNWDSLDSFSADVSEGRRLAAEEACAPLVVPRSSTIRLENVVYTYPQTTAPAIKKVDLTIRPNTITAFVGPSGSGKSTLADIVLGMLIPDSGTIKVGNTRIEQNNVRAWQRYLGYVPQNIFVIDDSVRANITFGSRSRTVDEKKLADAARMANVVPFINDLPGGYDFVVGERGARLSGGQRQRLGIARALYHDADFLVLDEATSALDPVTEREIMATIMDLRATKTIIMVTHRLTTIRLADQIVLLGGGEVLDVGTYDELVARHKDFQAQVSAENEVAAPAAAN